MQRGLRIHPRTLALAASLLAVVLLFGVQIAEVRHSAERTIGIVIAVGSEERPGILIEEVAPGRPAERAGIRAGDRILEVNGLVTVAAEDYDVAAATFDPAREVLFRIERDGSRHALPVVPGVPMNWGPILVNAVQLCCLLALAALAMLKAWDRRALLMAIFSLLLALEVALPPQQIVGAPIVSILTVAVFYLVTGAQMGVELHLATLIPERPGWAARRPWVIPVYYVAGLGLGILSFATFVLERLATGGSPFPWTSEEITDLLFEVGLPVWALLVVLLLSVPTFRHPEAPKRHQAGLVLLGVLPWSLYAVAVSVPGLLDPEQTALLGRFLPLFLLCYPAAVFVAIFRFHLFDLELVVRKSMVYTLLTSTLLLVFYAALGAGGALFSRLLGGDRDSVWVVSSATLILGLLFSPLRRRVQDFIDRRMAPEREALHRQLTRLASELPALGRLQLMGEHLAARCSEIFLVRSTTVLLTDPASGFLVTLAAHPDDEQERGLTLLLSPEDAGVQLLRDSARPVEANEVASISPALAQRLRPMAARHVVAMTTHDTLVGLLIVGEKTEARAFRSEELELLGLLAHHAATVFENVRLFQSATYEALTGLRRREAILEVLEQELQRAIRYERPLTVALADLDHFKDVNDRYGHLAGDALLKRVAGELEAGLRTTDAIGRYGGEEFLLVFPETDLDGATTVAEKIRRRIEGIEVRMEDGTLARVRVSVGLAALQPDEPYRSGQTGHRLIERADKALYRAKAAGRNRVEAAIA